MMFDTTISLGTVLQTIALLGSAAYFIWSLRTSLAVMDTKQATALEKIIKIETELDKLTEVIIEQAKHSQRLDNFETRMQEFSSKIYNGVSKRVRK